MNLVLIRESIGRGPIKNIGDFIQSIAQRQFWKGTDAGVIDIERLRDTRNDVKINLIMNGWFMWYPAKFPPPSNVNSLFVSFHLTPSIEQDFFTQETIEYLKAHEPIGARDYNTMRMLKSHGVESYFSNCLTLTLDKSYKQEKHDGGVIFCEPYIDFGNNKKEIIWNLLKSILFWLSHPIKSANLYKKYTPLKPHNTSIRLFLTRIFEVARFYEVYSKCFSDNILLEAEYVSHLVDNYTSINHKFKLADDLLQKYAKAKLVITSRIHAGLPCLALETPCIFVNENQLMYSDAVRPGGRFEGIVELFNVMSYDNGELKYSKDDFILPINVNNIPKNKDSYKYYQTLLDNKVSDFVNKALKR